MDAVRGAKGIADTVPLADAASPKLRKAAEDFEAVLLGSLLEQMEQAVQEGAGDSTSGDMKGLGVQQLARTWAERGGVGIARTLLPYLERQSPASDGAKLKVPRGLPMIVRAGLSPAATK